MGMASCGSNLLRNCCLRFIPVGSTEDFLIGGITGHANETACE
jgi:hypothetical protein